MLAQRKFQRIIENFVCEKCGMAVEGNGYTDHCPNCLWGKHVDVNPGDRAAGCGGMMKPVHIQKKKEKYIINYVCQKCGHEFNVKSDENDDFEKLLEINKIHNS